MFQVPFLNNDNFVGRHDILAKIDDDIRKNKSNNVCVPIVLKGLGGMGKSQLMLKYCYSHRKEYDYVFWLHAEDSEVLDEFYNLAEKLGIKADNDEALSMNIRMWF